MHCAALGIVTSLSEEAVRQILTDVFAALVEVSRRTTKEASLCLKGVGSLHLFKNRELAWLSHDIQFDQLASEKVNQFRQQMRDDISHIDAASAVLSQGQGKAFSIRSSQMGRSSVGTPGTRFDNASSASRPS